MGATRNLLLERESVILCLFPKVCLTSISDAIDRGYHTPYKKLRRLTPDEVRRSKLLKVALVRHPLDRLVSAWRNRFEHLSFEQLVQLAADSPDHNADRHLQAQTYIAPYLDRFFRFECLPHSWDAMRRLLRFHHVELPDLNHLNPSARPPDWHSLYTPKLLELAVNRYQADLDRFGYRA